MDVEQIDVGQIAIIAIFVTVALLILQFVFRSLGKFLRWLISIVAIGLCVYLLWKGGAFQWVDARLDGLSAAISVDD